MSGKTLTWRAQAGGPLRGMLRVPGDKSISHRAIMLGSLAHGTTRVRGFLEGEDTLRTAESFRALGVRIDAPSVGERIVHGVGREGLHEASAALDLGNSGTGMRLIAGVLAGRPFASTLVGDASLSRRPMRRILDPLRRMGARIDAEPGDLAPLRIVPVSGRLQGIEYSNPVPSAQVKSCVLLAGLDAEGETRVREAHATRDHTERMLRAFGCAVVQQGSAVMVRGGSVLRATEVAVPADFSSAAFFLVAATLVPGSDLVLQEVGVNPLRTGLIEVLLAMGANIQIDNRRQLGGEPVADLRVRHARLRGIAVPERVVADMIDEFPVLFAAAACAEGTTTLRGAGELRVKESDRIATMAAALRGLGVGVTERPDGAVIEGGALLGGEVDSAGDHRIAMAAAVAAQLAQGPVRIHDCANVATSFPGFVALATSAGMGLREERAEQTPATD
jgi:3-phosphoshikimate 1-carboxyvinyltransferase